MSSSRSDAGVAHHQPSAVVTQGTDHHEPTTRDPVSPCVSCTSEITRLQGEVDKATDAWDAASDRALEAAGTIRELTAQLAKAEATLTLAREFVAVINKRHYGRMPDEVAGRTRCAQGRTRSVTRSSWAEHRTSMTKALGIVRVGAEWKYDVNVRISLTTSEHTWILVAFHVFRWRWYRQSNGRFLAVWVGPFHLQWQYR